MPCSRAPNGLAQAFVIGADFVRGHSSCLILGDNIIYGHGLPEVLRRASERKSGATIFGYWVDDPERYGVIEFNERSKVLSIEEKPKQPKSNWAAIGALFLRRAMWWSSRKSSSPRRAANTRSPISTIFTCGKGDLAVERLGRGFAWLDAGTYDLLLEAAEFMRVLQHRQGQLDRRSRGDRVPQWLD